MAGKKALLTGVTARFLPGRVTAILGPNGAGKSTLLTLLTGQRRPDGGQVLLDGIEVHGQSPQSLAARRAVVAQESAVAFEFTAREIVELGRFPHRHQPGQDEAAIVERALEATQMEHLADRSFHTLSGGEKGRVHLARALAQVWEPCHLGLQRWLLLDEPTAALDLAHQHQAMNLLRRWAREQGIGVVAVLHDLNLALRYADDAIVLEQGKATPVEEVNSLLSEQLIASVWRVSCAKVQTPAGMDFYAFG